MPFVFMTDPITKRCALFEENGNLGSPKDPNALRNAPLNNPTLYLDKIRFHSDFDYYQVHSGPTSVTINHPSLTAQMVAITEFPQIQRKWTRQVTSHVLLNHGLPYVPAFMIISNNRLIAPGSDIQSSSKGFRNITPYATSTSINLREYYIAEDLQTLDSIQRTYQVIVFKNAVEDSPFLLDYNPTTDSIIMGKGKFRSALKSLRKAKSSEDSRFDISLGRTVDIKNGGSRTVLPDGTTFTDPWYNGNFTGSQTVQGIIE